MLTVSDRVSRGEAADGSGDTLAELLAADGFDVVRRVVPDEADEIAAAITALAADAPLVLTTGGTGWLRATSRRRRRAASSSERCRASPRRSGRTRSRRRRTGFSRAARLGFEAAALVVNLPGSTGGCRDGYAVLRPALGHALALLRDEPTEHQQTPV